MFDEDFSAFLDIEEHASEFVIQKSGKIFTGIIDRDYVETLEMSGYQPVITCKTSDVKNLSRGDVIEDYEDSKKLYKFIHEEADGTGMSKLILNLLEG